MKSLQRKGRKNFLVSILAVRTGMKGDRLIEGQNVFLFFPHFTHRLGIFRIEETLEFIWLNIYVASPGISCYIPDKCFLSL